MDGKIMALAVAAVLGFLAGLGVGGGSLLVLWLTLILKLPPEEARAINLLFFLPTAVIATVIRKKQKQLRVRVLLPGALAGCAGALLFSYIGGLINTEALQIPFGIFLIATGLQELFYRPRKDR